MTGGGVVKHGHAIGGVRSPTYRSWQSMLGRCLNANDPSYNSYGASGVAVCKRWLSFRPFLADMGERPNNTSLDRIDNSLGYFRANCRWATRREQQLNRSVNVRLTVGGRTQCLSEWADEVGVDPRTISKRIKLGWPAERALSQPTNTSVLVTLGDRTQCVAAWCRELGRKKNTVCDRIKRGWTPEMALTAPINYRSRA